MLPQRDTWGPVYFVLSKFNALRYLWPWLLGFLLWHHRHKGLYAFTLACSVVVLFHEHTPERLSIFTYLIAAGSVIGSSFLPARWLSRRSADFLGELSFPLYLVHYPLFIAAYLADVRSTAAMLGLVRVSTLVARYGVDRHLKRRFIIPWVMRSKQWGQARAET